MERFAAGSSLDVHDRFFQGACRARANGDEGAFACEFFRDGAAQSFAGRRDDGYATCELWIHSTTPLKTLIVSRNAECVNNAVRGKEMR
jgi:hypothetical protein